MSETEIAEHHDYSEEHEFVVQLRGRGREHSMSLEANSDPSKTKLVFRSASSNYAMGGQTVHHLSLTELSQLVDLINHYLLWSKYSYATSINEGERLSVQPKIEVAGV